MAAGLTKAAHWQARISGPILRSSGCSRRQWRNWQRPAIARMTTKNPGDYVARMRLKAQKKLTTSGDQPKVLKK
jgi:Ni,Fe-hydrogenase III large subunit